MRLATACVVALVSVVVLAPAAEAREKLTAVGICGPDRCNVSTAPTLLEDLAGLVFSPATPRPAPGPGSYHVVDAITAEKGVVGKGVFLPQTGMLHWRQADGKAVWLRLPAHVDALLRSGGRGAAPYEPAVERVTLAGKDVAEPSFYAELFGPHQAVPPSAGHAVPISVRWSEGNAPWPSRLSYQPASKTLVRDGETVRLPAALSARIERDAGLKSGRSWGWYVGAALLAAAGAAALLLGRRRRPWGA